MNVLVVAILFIGSTATDPFKCGGIPNTFPGYDASAPVVLVDDRVLPASEGVEGIRDLDVGLLTVSCWNPDTGEFGVPPGIPLVRVVTRAEYRDVAATALSAVLRQTEANRQTGEYITSLDGLGLEDVGDVTLRLDSDGSIWSLVVQSRFQRCEVSSEVAAEVTRESLANDVCVLRSEEQSAALRRAFDGTG